MSQMLSEEQKKELAKVLEPASDVNSPVPLDVSFFVYIYTTPVIH